MVVQHLEKYDCRLCPRSWKWHKGIYCVLASADVLILSKDAKCCRNPRYRHHKHLLHIWRDRSWLAKDNELPVILNGSFALKLKWTRGNSIKTLWPPWRIKYRQLQRVKMHVFNFMRLHKRRMEENISHDHDNILPPSVCLFPSKFNKNEYYTPFAYDSVLTIAHLYNDILSKGDVKIIENGYLNNIYHILNCRLKAQQEQYRLMHRVTKCWWFSI